MIWVKIGPQAMACEGDAPMTYSKRTLLVGLVLVLFLSLLAGPAYAQGKTHVVKRGETLTSIARQYGTTVQALVKANGLRNANHIYVGQKLAIGTQSSPPKSGTSSGTYTVRRGDTLFSIARRHGTTVAKLRQANQLANANVIYVGQRLKIPGGGSQPVSQAPKVTGKKRIVVDLSEQRMYVYQDGQLLWKWVVSTGGPNHGTSTGNFRVLNKIPNAYASTWNLQMPYWLGIYWAGHLQNGIHALPIQANGQRLWAGYLGRPVSFGCIILGTQQAQTLYNWATVGTAVDVVW